MNNMIDNKFSVGYYKCNLIDIVSLEKNYIPSTNDLPIDYNPFYIDKLQNYNPIYDNLFSLSKKNYNSIQLNHSKHIVNIHSVIDLSNIEYTKEIFFKFSPLLDPLRYMVGKYEDNTDLLQNLPVSISVSNDISHNVISKISSPYNCAYVDTFFYYLSSMTLHQHKILNCLDFYGSFLGIQKKYKYDVSDDIEYLTESSFFINNNNRLFTLQNVDLNEYQTDDSRKQRPKLCISKSNHNISAISIANSLTGFDDITDITNETLDNCIVYENNTQLSSKNLEGSENEQSDDNSSVTYTTDTDDDGHDNDCESDSNKSDSNESVWETSSDTSNDDSICSTREEEQYVYINNYPVQMICLEKCDGTFDDLFTSGNATLENTASALFQVVMTLIIYQRLFSFTHNDLHTNNIMYIKTNIPFLFYKYDNIIYKVPTYGRIYKIIDFGRSIYRFNGTTYCSDSFGPGGDADTQYNCEPFFNDKKPRLEPNMSFDLCRLGCSIYDFIIPEHLKYDDYDELQKTIHRWCLDDNKKNVLYKSNGDERYPDFKLYKMIARTVHKHTPQEQLKYSFFNQFVINNNKYVEKHLMDINCLPKYY